MIFDNEQLVISRGIMIMGKLEGILTTEFDDGVRENARYEDGLT